MIYRITIKHSKNDRLLCLVEQEIHNRLPGVLSGMLKDMMADGTKFWFQLEFDIECHALGALCDRLFWAEVQLGYCLDIPVDVHYVDEITGELI